jgi:hypothetical protein
MKLCGSFFFFGFLNLLGSIVFIVDVDECCKVKICNECVASLHFFSLLLNKEIIAVFFLVLFNADIRRKKKHPCYIEEKDSSWKFNLFG